MPDKQIEQIQQTLAQLTAEERESLLSIAQTLHQSQQSPHTFIERLIGFEIIEADHERAIYRSKMNIRDEIKNKMDILHGGALATFVDTSMGAAIYQAFTGERCVTIDLHLQFLSPGYQGELRAETKIVKAGRKTVFVATEVYEQSEQLIAMANGVFYRR